MVKLPIYMDNHATTPMDQRVLAAMLPYFTEKFGNAASRNHSFGWAGEEAVDKARGQIAALINAKSKEIIFTSGATESDNLAIKGVVEFYKDKGNHVITCVTEHKAILDSCKALERAGKATVTYLPVDNYGMVDPERCAPGDYGQDHPDHHHGRQQRDWHDSSDRRNRPDRQGEGHHLSQRCHPGRGQDSDGRGEGGNRPALGERPQDLRPQGHWDSLRALQGTTRSPDPDYRRRRA